MAKRDEVCFVCWGRGRVYYPAVGAMTPCHYCHGADEAAAKKARP